MFKHIVVAVDFSPAWEVLSKHLPKLRGWGCEYLTLVHVLPTNYPLAPAESHRGYYETRLEESANALKSVGFRTDYRVIAGDPAAALVDVAQEANADCLLAGSHGHSTLRDFFLGSTVLNVARLTSLPLLIIPVHVVRPPSARVMRVVLGSDCSEAARAAEAIFLALVDEGAEGTAVCALERGRTEDSAQEIHCAKAHVERLNRGRTTPIDARIEHGFAPELITRIAQDVQADLIVIGKRGYNRMRELLLGSTAEAVCRRAQIPVVLIPG